ncbi:MAG: TonB-dependent receptor [Sphingobacteriales bacterium]|jgi:vitamin B12 transporter|nr:TonB-dependent receptor [Sphingobacteriales bacterium]
MHTRFRIFTFLQLVFPMALFAQGIALPELEVKGRRSLFVQTLNEQEADTGTFILLSTRSLADLLEREPGMALRSYGSGGSSLLSLRGSTAAQTRISWNGLSLNSPMLGVCDLSLVPAFLSGPVYIQYGGTGSSGGDGAIGGHIRIEESVDDSLQTETGILALGGSFGEQQLGVSFQTSSGKLSLRTRVYGNKSDNDFEYIRPGGEQIKQTHATFEQAGLTQSLRYRTGSGKIGLDIWHVETQREIPAHMLATLSLQEQDDQNSRASAFWLVESNRGYFRLRSGVSHDRIHYADPTALLDDHSKSLQLQTDVEGSVRLSRSTGLQLQGLWSRASAVTDYYPEACVQDWYSAAGKLRWTHRKLTTVFGIRQAWFEGKAVPVLPSFESIATLNKNVKVSLEAARVFRLPTLNDRFWLPGGNPDLKPEQGYSVTAGLSMSSQLANWSSAMRLAVFASEISNAIVWLPNDQAIYSAVNMHRIGSKGIELDFRLNRTWKKWKVLFAAMPSLTFTEVKQTSESFEYMLNRQLVYTPRVMYRFEAELSYQSIGLRALHRYTGYRYTTEDHAHFLEPFSLTDIFLNWKILRGKYNGVTLNIGVRNLFNEAYQVMAWRAMPGRSWQAGMYFPLSW